MLVFVFALLLNGALWAYLALRMSALPDVLPIHFNSAGQADRIGLRTELFILPIIGTLAIAANTAASFVLRSRERQLIWLLAGTSVLVQLLLAAAIVQILH